MNAAPAPALALVPPAPPPPVPAADRERRIRRVRAVCTAGAMSGALLPVVCTLSEPYLGEPALALAVLSWMLLFAGVGFALALCAAINRTRADLKALLLAGATAAAAFSLLPVAARVGTEAYVSSHAAELDRLAERVRAALPPGARNGGQQVYEAEDGKLYADVRAHHLLYPRAVDGGIVFGNDGIFAPKLFYADGVASAVPFTCRDVKAIGGRWYRVDCTAPAEHGD
jgi:hypothetical protein